MAKLRLIDWTAAPRVHGEVRSPCAPDFLTSFPPLLLPDTAASSDPVAFSDLEDMLSVARMGVWHWRADTDEVALSAECFRITGRDPAQLPPTLQAALAMIHPADRRRVRSAVRRTLETSRGEMWDARIVRLDGSIRSCIMWARGLRSRTGLAYVRGSLLDVTDRRDAQRTLTESEQDYRSIIELNPQIPWIADADGKVIDVGMRWEDLVGLPREQAFRGGWAAALHPEDREGVLRNWAAALTTGDPIDVRYRLIQPDGSYRWFRARAGARRDPKGAIVRWYGLLEDIDGQVTTELALEEARLWLQTAHEAAGIGLFEVDLQEGQIRLSPQSLAMLGIEAGSETLKVDPSVWTDRVDPDDAEAAWEAAAHSVATGELYDFIYRVPLPEGDYRWINGIGRAQYDEGGRALRLLGINIDLTERIRAEQALAESENLNRSIVEASPDMVVLLDLAGTILFAHDRPARAYAAIGGRWTAIWPPEAQEDAERALSAARGGGVGRFCARTGDESRSFVWWDVVVTSVTGTAGKPIRLLSVARDITQQRASEDAVRWAATHDTLTGLPNRALFQEQLDAAIAAAGAARKPLVLLELDIDRFKQVNDTYGHDAGDRLLSIFAERVRQQVGGQGTVARLGGDEFAVILPGLTVAEAVTTIVDPLLAALREPFAYDGTTLDCGASVGGSLYPTDGTSAEELLKSADIALYRAKSPDGTGFSLFQSAMRAELQQRVSALHIARDAAADGRISAFYQPKIDIASGRCIGFEALLRWQDPRGNMRGPVSILPAFEHFELATQLSDAVLDRIVTDVKHWRQKGIPFGHVAMNLAETDFRREGFVERLLGTLQAAAVPSSAFQIEVTETVFLGRGAQSVKAALGMLSLAGVKIALDDFGTGFASLTHLKQLPIDLIKIDRSFVSGLDGSGGDHAIVTAICGLGRSLGKAVVAEGVERAEQLEALRALGCDMAQGYLFSPAVPSSEVPRLLRRDDQRPSR